MEVIDAKIPKNTAGPILDKTPYLRNQRSSGGAYFCKKSVGGCYKGGNNKGSFLEPHFDLFLDKNYMCKGKYYFYCNFFLF